MASGSAKIKGLNTMCNCRFVFLAGCLAFCALTAQARNTEGALDLIRVPNNGQPVQVLRESTFEVILREACELSLSGETGVYPMAVTWHDKRGDRVSGSAVVPSHVPSGTYALQGECQNIRDVNLRSVYVVDAFPDAYALAHITDMHTGSGRHKRSDRDILIELIQQVNAAEAQFALITGDVTDGGTPEEFRRFLDILDTCRMPTYITPGNHDRTGTHYADYFERLTYAFQYGRDGYLSFDTKDYLIADEMGVQSAHLYLYRRQLRPCRWSIGLTHRYDPGMGIHAQLTLFVDDPLDYLLVGHTHREARMDDQIPWGKTDLIMTPAAINGSWRLIRVDSQGLHPEATVSTVSVFQEKDELQDEEREDQ